MVVVLVNLIAMSGNMSSGKTKSRIPLRQQELFSLCVSWTVGMRAHSPLVSLCNKETGTASTLLSDGPSCRNQETMRSRQSGHRSPKGVGSGDQSRAWLTGSWLTLPSILLVSVMVLPFHYLHSYFPSFLHSKSGCLLPVRHCARCSAGS